MEFERAVQELKGRIKDYAEDMLTKSKTKGQYVCVFCGSGQGVKATGALKTRIASYTDITWLPAPCSGTSTDSLTRISSKRTGRAR